MSLVRDDVLAANAAYSSAFGHRARLACRRRDASQFSLAWTPGSIPRNMVISYKPLGTREWFVVHHTDCGMQLFTDAVIADLLQHSLETATITQDGWKDVGSGPGSVAGKFIKWHTFDNLGSTVQTRTSNAGHWHAEDRGSPALRAGWW